MDGYWTFVWIFINLIVSSKDCCGQETLNIQPSPTATVKEGDSLTFTCTYRNNACPSAGLFIWVLNGEQALFLFWRYNSCVFEDGNAALNYTCGIAQDMCEITLTLTLTQVQRSQHGDVWGCRLYCMQKDSTIFVNVPIISVDVISPRTLPVTVSENSPSTFVCETSAGRPQATITWYKQLGTNAAVPVQVGFITTTSNGTLVITRSTLQYMPTRSDHDYRVYCTAYNIDVSSTLTSNTKPQMYVQYAPDTGPVIEGRTSGSTFYILDGKPQSLTCSIEGGRPLASLSWNCFSGAVQDQSSGTNTQKQVTWTAAKSHDGQPCTCQSSHHVWTSTHQVFVTIEALYPPSLPTFTVLSQPVSSNVSVIEGTSVSVTCSSTNYPPPVYSWTPTGSSSSRDILTLTSVSTSNSGVYTCTVTNTMSPTQGDPESGSNSASITLDVLFPPRAPVLRYSTSDGPLISSVFNVVRADSFGVYCKAEGNPEPSYQWTGQSANNNRLTVTGIQTDTSWTCTATNDMVATGAAKQTGSSSATATANVLYSASITEFTINGAKGDGPFTYDENTTITIACVVDSNPGSEITLSRDGSVIVKVTNRKHGTLIIEEASCVDAGMYTCTAKNQYNGISYSSLSRHVYLRCPPRPVDSVNNFTYYYALNETVTLNLTVTAYPEPTSYRWYKQDREITRGISMIVIGISKTSHQTNLTMEQIEQDDLGQYKVVATNDLGRLEHLFFVARQEMAPSENGGTGSSVSIIVGAAGGGSAFALIFIVIVLLVIRRYKLSNGFSWCMLSKSGTEQDQRDEINSHHVNVNTTASPDITESEDNIDRNMYDDLNMTHLQPQLYEQLQQGKDETFDQATDKRDAYETLDHASVKSQLYDPLQQTKGSENQNDGARYLDIKDRRGIQRKTLDSTLSTTTDHLTETPKVYENLRLN